MASIIEEIVFESKTLPPGFEVLLEQKAADLFAICDQEDKGFVTKRDMQRLKDELPLGPDQLENVFDALDQDQNGYLTLEEFTKGFEGFLGLESVISKCRAGRQRRGQQQPRNAPKWGLQKILLHFWLNLAKALLWH